MFLKGSNIFQHEVYLCKAEGRGAQVTRISTPNPPPNITDPS